MCVLLEYLEASGSAERRFNTSSMQQEMLILDWKES